MRPPTSLMYSFKDMNIKDQGKEPTNLIFRFVFSDTDIS